MKNIYTKENLTRREKELQRLLEILPGLTSWSILIGMVILAVQQPLWASIIIIALENKLGDLGIALASRSGIEWFNTLGEAVSMVTGLIFVVCVLLFRRGIVGEIIARLPDGNSKKAA